MKNTYEEKIISETGENQETKVRKSPDSLRRKRFLLPQSPELRAKIKDLQKAIIEFKGANPEVICLLLYGSFVKGYATEKSDFDGFLLIDEDAIKEEIVKHEQWIAQEAVRINAPLPRKSPERAKTLSFPSEDDIREMKIKSKAMSLFLGLNKILKEKGFTEGQLTHLRPEIVSKEKIVQSFQKDPKNIAYFFMMAIGSNEICRYRKVIFDELERLGDKKIATYQWQDIMRHLHIVERQVNGNLAETWSLYPKTLEDGKKYFLRT